MCIENNQISGLGTNTLPNASALFLPLHGSQECIGCLAVMEPLSDLIRLQEPTHETATRIAANQLALALERDQLAIEAAESQLQAETELMRNTL